MKITQLVYRIQLKQSSIEGHWKSEFRKILNKMLIIKQIWFIVFNLLLNVTWTHAQNIEYNKCSCDSLFNTVFLKNQIQSYSDQYEGKRRYIRDNKCTLVSESDSIIVSYDMVAIFSNSDKLVDTTLISFKVDSTIFHFKNDKLVSEIEVYKRKIHDVIVEFKYYKKDLGLEIRLQIEKSSEGIDSLITYFSEKSVSPVYEESSHEISYVYVSSYPMKHTLTVNADGYLDGVYYNFCPEGEIKSTQTFSNGVREGYHYYQTTCKLKENEYGEISRKGRNYTWIYSEQSEYEYEKGFYHNGKREGKWVQNIGGFSNRLLKNSFKRYKLKFDQDEKVYRKRFLRYKLLNRDSKLFFLDLSTVSGEFDRTIGEVNSIYLWCCSLKPEGVSGYEFSLDPKYKIVKIK